MMPKSTKTSLPSASTNRLPGMHVGVEEAVAQRVAQEGLDHRARQMLEIEALGFERGAVVQRRAVDPFQRQHVLGGAVPVHRRHAEVGIGLGVLRHLRQRGGFEPQVHLDRDRAAQASRRSRSCAAAAPRPTGSRRGARRRRRLRDRRGSAARRRAAAPSRRPACGRPALRPRRDAPARSRRRRPPGRTTRRPPSAACRARPRPRLRPRPAGTAPSCPAAIPGRARARRRRRPAASPGTGRA